VAWSSAPAPTEAHTRSTTPASGRLAAARSEPPINDARRCRMRACMESIIYLPQVIVAPRPSPVRVLRTSGMSSLQKTKIIEVGVTHTGLGVCSIARD